MGFGARLDCGIAARWLLDSRRDALGLQIGDRLYAQVKSVALMR